MVATFLFVSFILSIKYVNGSKELIHNALAIGVVLFGMASTIGGITGGCLNPAVGLTLTIFQRLMHPSTDHFFDHDLAAVYVFAPALGGILAGLFQLVNQRIVNRNNEMMKVFDERDDYKEMYTI